MLLKNCFPTFLLKASTSAMWVLFLLVAALIISNCSRVVLSLLLWIVIHYDTEMCWDITMFYPCIWRPEKMLHFFAFCYQWSSNIVSRCNINPCSDIFISATFKDSVKLFYISFSYSGDLVYHHYHLIFCPKIQCLVIFFP